MTIEVERLAHYFRAVAISEDPSSIPDQVNVEPSLYIVSGFDDCGTIIFPISITQVISLLILGIEQRIYYCLICLYH